MLWKDRIPTLLLLRCFSRTMTTPKTRRSISRCGCTRLLSCLKSAYLWATKTRSCRGCYAQAESFRCQGMLMRQKCVSECAIRQLELQVQGRCKWASGLVETCPLCVPCMPDNRISYIRSHYAYQFLVRYIRLHSLTVQSGCTRYVTFQKFTDWTNSLGVGSFFVAEVQILYDRESQPHAWPAAMGSRSALATSCHLCPRLLRMAGPLHHSTGLCFLALFDLLIRFMMCVPVLVELPAQLNSRAQTASSWGVPPMALCGPAWPPP